MPTNKRSESNSAEAGRAAGEADRTQELRSDLAAADRRWAIDRAISALTHDMAQPLTSIANYANACARLLRAGTASPQVLLDAMQQMAAEALRANEMIRRARGESAQGESPCERLSINELVREVVAAEQLEIEGHQIALSLLLAEGLPAVQVDRLQIQVVLSNLVRNALEAMSSIPPERRLLTIETRREDDAVSVRVVDSGPAVDSTILARMFDLYFTTKPRRPGLGLSVCHMLVKAHGGRLGADPNDASGLTLQFSLPASVE